MEPCEPEKPSCKRPEPAHCETTTHEMNKECHDSSSIIRRSIASVSNMNVSNANCGEVPPNRVTQDPLFKQHAQDAPFSGKRCACHLCTNDFPRRSGLIEHLPGQTGEKRFACHLCSKAFAMNSHLRLHLSNHTTHDAFRCSLCPSLFPSLDNLTCHTRRAHRLRDLPSTTEENQAPKCGGHEEACTVLPGTSQMQSLDGGCEEDSSPVCNAEENVIISGSTGLEENPGMPTATTGRNCPPDLNAQHTYHCRLCPNTFEILERREGHVVNHMVEDQRTGPLCSEVSVPKDHLSSHSEHVPENTAHWTRLPSSVSQDQADQAVCVPHNEVRNVESSTSASNRHQGHVWANEFSGSRKLTRHLKTDCEVKGHTCELCGLAFSRRSSLRRHVLAHNGEKPFRCDRCSSSFTRKFSLQRHVRIVHENRTAVKPAYPRSMQCPPSTSARKRRCKLFPCPFCPEQFEHKATLGSHISTHSGDKPFQCGICFQTFPHQNSLNGHRWVHAGGSKAFKCSVCSSTFNGKAELEEHCLGHSKDSGLVRSTRTEEMEANSGPERKIVEIVKEMKCETNSMKADGISAEKTFQPELARTEICEEAQGQDRRLEGVTQVKQEVDAPPHGGEESTRVRFQCHLCPRDFSQRGSLRDHLKKHGAGGGKSYQCYLCPQTFFHLSNMRRHVRSHTAKKPFQCQLCQRSFARRDRIRDHEQKVHGRKSPVLVVSQEGTPLDTVQCKEEPDLL